MKSTTNRILREAKKTPSVWKQSMEDENPGESFADPLHQSHDADDVDDARNQRTIPSFGFH